MPEISVADRKETAYCVELEMPSGARIIREFDSMTACNLFILGFAMLGFKVVREFLK